MSERKVYYQRVADDTNQLAENRRAEESNKQRQQPQGKRNRPFTEILEKIVPPQDLPLNLGPRQQAYVEKAQEAGFEVEEDDSLSTLIDREGPRVFRRGPNKKRIDHDPIVLALIAAVTRPEEYEGRVGKHKGETDEQVVFRLATGEISNGLDHTLLTPSMIGSYIKDVALLNRKMDSNDPRFTSYTRDVPYLEGSQPEDDEELLFSAKLIRRYHELFDIDVQENPKDLLKKLATRFKDLPLTDTRPAQINPRILPVLLEQALSEEEELDTEDEDRYPEISFADAKSRIELVRSQTFVHEFLEALKEGAFTAEDARSELTEAANKTRRRKARKVNWLKLLPPEPTERARSETTPREPQTGESRSRRHDERIDYLFDLVEAWGGEEEGEVLESTFNNKRTKYPYYAAILRDRLPDGTIIEHAILDNPGEGNSIFAFRGEKGISEDGIEETTWIDVFNEHYKPEALAAGAKKFNHSKHMEQNILDYLTEEPRKL